MPSSAGRERITLVAAVAANGVIGAAGGIPWRIPEDFAHFKRVTLGHTLVMGRATYDSIGRPLPGRTTVVLTRDPGWSAEGVQVAASLEEALTQAGELPGEVMVVGGAAVYAAALPIADAQILTEVHLSPEGDTRYPDWDRGDWVETVRLPGPGLEWVWWERRA
ncbi:dihydrofolate reductase [Nocardioides agariphilus]|uniref:Dihydrofolate reductase n=1 Tax=Nocardioides agariphilus TaxID=433664 RepID=A0A930VHZ8_9ACTN|nr:dihydrofolate reductase [Nocardioides agariphilus]MBF4767028.1 dihydrofolate reductase [Nocardioides agariphilus]